MMRERKRLTKRRMLTFDLKVDLLITPEAAFTKSTESYTKYNRPFIKY